MKQKIYDILIVGAGPCGSAAAITLAKQGHSVLLIDQYSFPRDKVCGDGLTGNSVRMLKKLGVWDDIEKRTNNASKTQIFLTMCNSFILNISVHTLKRKKLDKILLDTAISCGAKFEVLKFTGNIQNKEEFSLCEVVDGKSAITEIKAKTVLLAVGCQYPDILRKNKLLKSTRTDMISVRGYYHADWKLDNLSVFFIKKYRNNGYLWVFPMGNNEYNIGCGTTSYQKIDLKSDLNEFVCYLSKKRNVPIGHWTSPPKGAILRSNLSNLEYNVAGNVLLAGEAIGSTFMLTGEGIGMALETGIIAAEVIHKALVENDFSLLAEYKVRINKELKIKYLPYRIGFFIYKLKILSWFFKLEFVNKVFYMFLIRCIRSSNCISKKRKGV